jgi:hypothetical protein
MKRLFKLICSYIWDFCETYEIKLYFLTKPIFNGMMINYKRKKIK